MKNGMSLAVAMLITVLGAVLLASVANMSDGDEPPYSIEQYAPEMAAVFTYSNVIIISDVEGERTVKELAPNVRVQETFDNIEGIDVVMIEAGWAKLLDKEYLYSNVDQLIIGSHPLMIIGGDGPWIFWDREIPAVSLSHSFDKEDIFCLFYNAKTGTSHCNSITGQNMQESLEVACNWTKELMDEYAAGGA